MTITGINGSVNVVEGMKNLFKENAKVSFTAAADTAQKQVPNGTILAGRLGVTQGYLTYRYLVVDIEKQTAYRVIIDAGNGEILYTSQGHQIGSFSQQQEPRMFGPFMAGGFGHWNVKHQSFGSEAGDFWHGGSFGHCGPSRP
jgi:hypothetical protein